VAAAAIEDDDDDGGGGVEGGLWWRWWIREHFTYHINNLLQDEGEVHHYW